MSKEAIAMRMLCNEAQIDSQRYKNSRYLSEEDWHKLADAYEILKPLKLEVDDTTFITVSELRAKAMRFAIEHKALDLIVVDYLQRMKGEGKGLYEQATNISKDLKSVARDLKVPVLTMCQLSRAPENRTDHRPTMADLRDSGALEQDADQIAFIYREDQYKQKDAPKDNLAEIILGKNRNGPCIPVNLGFDAPSTRFFDVVRP
jgi:replicative DNA helicase